MVRYEGLFLDKESVQLVKAIEPVNLGFQNDEIHITFKYKPSVEETFDEIVGRVYELKVIGYGNDGKNSGFQVELPDELLPYYINVDENGNLKPPHITVSLAEGAKAKDTAFLDFVPLTPFTIKARFGYWTKKGRLSFEPDKTDDQTKKQ
jgi:hypothetical protein